MKYRRKKKEQETKSQKRKKEKEILGKGLEGISNSCRILSSTSKQTCKLFIKYR